AHQKLKHAVSDQLVQGQQFTVGGGDGFGVAGIQGFATGFERVGGFFNYRVGDHVAGHLPQSDETVDRSRKADREDAVVAGGTRRLVVQVERAVVSVAAKKHQHVQPVKRIHQADGDIHIVFEPVSVVDVEVPQLAGQKRTRESCPWRRAPDQL